MIRFRVLHLTVGIQTDVAPLLEDLERLTTYLGPSVMESPDLVYHVLEEGGAYTLRGDGGAWEGLGRGDIFVNVESDVARRLIRTEACALLHSAALCREGQVYLFAGCSGSGKTTLTAALLKRGFTLLSDEYGPLSLDDWSVEPCSMPLKLREATLRRLSPLPDIELLEHGFLARGEHVRYGVPAPAIVAAPGRYPLARLYFPWNRPELPTQAYRPRPSVAVQQVMDVMVNSSLLGERAFQLATDLVSGVPCLNLVVGDIDEACRIVCDEPT
jgi:energy-coupling factor transporter ATP-binding protein EcfA2